MSLKYVLLLSAFLPLQALAQTAASEPASSAPMIAATSPAAAVAAAPKPDLIGANAPVTHGEFEELVKKTLLDNPEIVMDAVKKLHDKHMEESNKQMQESMAKHKDELVNDTTSPSVGDSKTADVTVIEFFDYHCGYCKHMLPVMTQLIHNDKKVRVVFREFPILAEDSVLASRAAIAVYNIDKDKYFDFHTELMKSSGKFDEKSLAEAAKRVGVDPKKMKKEMDNPDITKLLDNTRAIAEDMGIRGTPALIVGGEMLPGAVPYEDLAKVIDNARKGVKPAETPKTQGAAAAPPPAPAPSAMAAPVAATAPATVAEPAKDIKAQ